MRYKIVYLILICLTFSSLSALSQENKENESVASENEPFDADLKHSIKSSLFILGNFHFDEPVYDTHLNYGYQLSQKEALIIEEMT